MRAHKGFVSHVGGPSPDGGWRVVKVWESEEDGQKWFDENVEPNLPPDIIPNRRYFPLHTALVVLGGVSTVRQRTVDHIGSRWTSLSSRWTEMTRAPASVRGELGTRCNTPRTAVRSSGWSASAWWGEELEGDAVGVFEAEA